MEMQAQDLTTSHRGWEASTMEVSIQNHKPIILSQSLSENPATFSGNHQHPLETTATLIKNPPKPIARPTSWATHEPRSRPKKKKGEDGVTEMGDRNGEDWSHWTEKEKERGVTEIWWKKEKYYFNEKERGWYKMLCGDCCVHDFFFFFGL